MRNKQEVKANKIGKVLSQYEPLPPQRKFFQCNRPQTTSYAQWMTNFRVENHTGDTVNKQPQKFHNFK